MVIIDSNRLLIGADLAAPDNGFVTVTERWRELPDGRVLHSTQFGSLEATFEILDRLPFTILSR